MLLDFIVHVICIVLSNNYYFYMLVYHANRKFHFLYWCTDHHHCLLLFQYGKPAYRWQPNEFKCQWHILSQVKNPVFLLFFRTVNKWYKILGLHKDLGNAIRNTILNKWLEYVFQNCSCHSPESFSSYIIPSANTVVILTKERTIWSL